MNQQEQFKKMEKLIYSRAWFYAVAYGMEFDDVKSQAFLIFCEAIERFDPAKAEFSTFLFHRLRTLNDYCKAEKQRMTTTSSIDEDVQTDARLDEKILFNHLVKQLSSDGRILLQGLLDRDFDNLEAKRFRDVNLYRIKKTLTRAWGWTNQRIERVWNEVRDWWLKNSKILETESII